MGRLRQLLLDQAPDTLYALLDAAVLDGLLDPMFRLGRRNFACLMGGTVDADVAHVAPYLLALAPDAALVEWLEARLDLPWGYLLSSRQPLRPLQRHLRSIGQVRGPRGEDLLFRFWDPRVLRSMATILDGGQLRHFMQDIERLYLLDRQQAETVHWDERTQRLLFSTATQAMKAGAIDHAGA